MSRLKHLIAEIHRRSLWQVLGLCLGASWVAFQVVKELTETGEHPMMEAMTAGQLVSTA